MIKTIQKRMQVFLLILTVWLLPSVAGAEECLDGFHTLNLEEPLAATCTTAGHRGGYTCSACNKHFSDAEGKAEIDKWETDALGHDFSENGFCKHGDAYEPAIEVTAENADSLGLDVNYYYGYYAIGNAGQLYWFASFVNDNGMTYASAVLTANIVVNDTASWKSWNDETEDLRTWMPINGYEGVFDGNSHTIAGLYHSSNDDAVGLFGLLNTGIIENTGVIASYIKGNKKVGGVCGEIPSGGIITNCYNTGTLNGWEKVGGVCG
ncbi:MAG: hypothetical protein MJZ24_09370, partial [Paludibacteraceae bacterium]|nr:hypothetical protein [Paludibacteraceae bacterium]